MEEFITNRKGLKGLKNVNRAMLAMMMALALGLWAPQLVSATSIVKFEPNDTGATAQNVNGSFSLDFDTNINDIGNLNTSTTIPHVSIRATGDGSYDFYRFTSNGGTIILDIDSTPSGNVGSDNDTEIALWNAAGNLLLQNDDSPIFDTGSSPGVGFCLGTNCHSIIQTAQVPGDYIVGVCRFDCGFGNDFLITGAAISPEGSYTLHISTPQDTGTVPTPEPSTMFLLASGLAGLGAYSRRRNAHKS
jgi:hypothetical protein